ncbi:hypothetical protein TCON_1502 [Astathelohania contejeani]|uniref:MarR family transcriptional regulator n=1 Tax=Astathelohania contejeani TaxID=164912 RepID=A0ABQ7HYQ2_9MICR|nr:hypothetical protein TCON_1502 [Thelohania contejeani]
MITAKEKIFQMGVFGDRISLLTYDELKEIYKEPWVEVITEEQRCDLRAAFTPLMIRKTQNKMLREYVESPSMELRRKLNNLYIKMNSLEWKNYLTNSSFQFTTKEFYFVFDILIRRKEMVPIQEIRTEFGITPKRMFYMIKKLEDLGYITRRGNDKKVSVMINRDPEGYVFKGTRKEKRKSINEADNVGENPVDNLPCTKLQIGTPLFYQVKKIVEQSRGGVSSKDLEKLMGIKLKLGYKLLTKLADKNESIKTVDEFEGKIKRTRFYSIEGLLRAREEQKKRLLNMEVMDGTPVTQEMRIDAIERILLTRPAFVLESKIFDELAHLLGITHRLDRRTIIRAAQDGGFNVFRVEKKGSAQSRYIIARNGISEHNPIVQGLIQPETEVIENQNEFQQNIYKFFVEDKHGLEIDNGYEPSHTKRLKMFYEFICQEMTIKMIRSIVFDLDLIGEMTIELFMALIPFSNVGYRGYISQLLKDKNEEQGFQMKLNGWSNWKKDHPFSYKFDLKNFDYFLKDFEIYRLLGVEVGLRTKLHKLSVTENIWVDIAKDEKKEAAFGIDRRLQFYDAVKNFPEEDFYNMCYSFIYEKYTDIELLYMKKRLDAFRKICPSIISAPRIIKDLPPKLFKTYKMIKNMIIEKNKVVFDTATMNYSDLEIILQNLASQRIISNYRTMNDLEKVCGSDLLRKKLKHRVNSCAFTEEIYYVSEFRKRDPYYDHFFEPIYHLLISEGSMDVNALLKHIAIMTISELEEFLEVFKDIFEEVKIEGMRIIGLKSGVDSFNMII